jgi:hypothetical protein
LITAHLQQIAASQSAAFARSTNQDPPSDASESEFSDTSEIEDAQPEIRRVSNSSGGRSTSSHQSKKKKSKKTRQSRGKPDDSSVESSQSLSQSFRANKENYRRSSQSEIMAKGKKTGTRKPTRQSKRLKKSDEEDFGSDSEAENSHQEPDFGKLSAETKTRKLQEQALLIAQLQAQVTNGKVKALQPVSAKKKSSLSEEEKFWSRAISDANKKYNWHKVKFCNSDDKLIALTANIFDKWNLKEFKSLKGQEREDAKAQWVAENQEAVRVAMNSVRNYAQAQVRDWVVDRLLKGQVVPTPDQMRLCALRDGSISTDPEMQEAFRLYHQDLLGKVLGKEHWDSWIRNYSTISSAKEPGTPTEANELCVVPNTEAFLVILFDNCWVKWHYVAELKKAGKKDSKRKDDRWKTKYIDANAGVAKWGGWNKAGRKAVKDLAKLIDAARKEDHVAQLEDECLQRVQANLGITVDDGEQAGKKKRKRKEAPAEVESDDEFDRL